MKKILTECYRTKLVINESVEKEPGVLAVVEGTFAEYDKKNLNGRNYTGSLWRKVRNSQKVKDRLQRKVMFGELDHPEEYVEIKLPLDRLALCVTNFDLDESTHTIQGQFKVLDSPAGQLLNTLIRFGSILGVSSRASGDLDEYGNVLEDTYDFETFDVVVNPSNAGALPTLVESVQGDDNMEKIKAALLESVKVADAKTLALIESIAQSLGKESADEIINKVEERKSSLKESEITDEMVMERLDRIEAKLDRLILAFEERFGASRAETEDSTKDPSAQEGGDVEIVESVSKSRARKRIIISEAQIRETPITASRVNEAVDTDDKQRQVNVIKANKTK